MQANIIPQSEERLVVKEQCVLRRVEMNWQLSIQLKYIGVTAIILLPSLAIHAKDMRRIPFVTPVGPHDLPWFSGVFSPKCWCAVEANFNNILVSCAGCYVPNHSSDFWGKIGELAERGQRRHRGRRCCRSCHCVLCEGYSIRSGGCWEVKFPKYELGGYFRESFFMWLLIKKHLCAGNRRFATTAEEQGEVT